MPVDSRESKIAIRVSPIPLHVLAPTFLEYWAARRVLRTAHVIRAGVKLSRITETAQAPTIVCGLAGALSPHLPPGTVLIPEKIGLPDGEIISCDEVLVRALTEAARSLGFEPESGLLLTFPTLITGADREHWFQRGFTAVDMETGLLGESGVPLATIRVVLDAPERGISEEWTRPASALLRPHLWGEFLWLCRAAPTYSLRAAQVLAAALPLLDETTRYPHPVKCNDNA